MDEKMKLFLLALLSNLLFISSCSEISTKNYEKLEMGMEYKEVREILGNPDTCTESIRVKSCTWGNEIKYIKVNFLSDKAVVFSSAGIE